MEREYVTGDPHRCLEPQQGGLWAASPVCPRSTSITNSVVAWRGMGRFERRFLTSMMGGDIEPAPTLGSEPNWWERAKAVLADSYTYRSFFWLLLRFPFGIAGFVIVVVGLSVPLSLLAAPIMLAFPESWDLGWIESVSWLVWLLPVIGVPLRELAHLNQGSAADATAGAVFV